MFNNMAANGNKLRQIITLPKTLQLKTLDFLQQMITMNENAQWQIIKDTVVFTLSSGFSVSLFHFYLKKKSTRGVLFCISSFFSLHRSLYLLLAYVRKTLGGIYYV
jgi:hypothetical protein